MCLPMALLLPSTSLGEAQTPFPLLPSSIWEVPGATGCPLLFTHQNISHLTIDFEPFLQIDLLVPGAILKMLLGCHKSLNMVPIDTCNCCCPWPHHAGSDTSQLQHAQGHPSPLLTALSGSRGALQNPLPEGKHDVASNPNRVVLIC